MTINSSYQASSHARAASNPDLEAQASSPASATAGDQDHGANREDDIPRLRHARTTFRSQTPRRSTTAASTHFNPNSSRGRKWQPGMEPGIDPHSMLPGTTPHLQSACDITMVEFDAEPEHINVSFYDNQSILELLDDLSKTDEQQCKWINVNGLSWDVISALGKAKQFHRLAIEDVLSRKNRTKADWYPDQAYIVLPLQKLIHIEEAQRDQEEDHSPGMFQRWFRKTPLDTSTDDDEPKKVDPVRGYEISSSFAQLKRNDTNALRTLQQYHGGPNQERIEFMEAHSALKNKGLNVAVEQVSIFLMSNNTVISFFEHSAEDIESAILTRLNRPDTVLRQSGDASMIVQAIIDGIIDLALPVTTAYQDAIDELELNVLTSPSLQHTSPLYVLQSEISQFRATVSPVLGLIESLRDHASPRALPSDDPAQTRPVNWRHVTGNGINGAASTVIFSPAAKIYLADIADHVSVVNDSLDQMRRATENLTALIFNSISAYQNESMRQLTMITIVFLPLSFITGYFGMNFLYFDGVMLHSDLFFWEIALPVVFVLAGWVLRDSIARWIKTQRQRLGIRAKRKRREGKMQ